MAVFSMPGGMLQGLLKEVYADIVHPDYYYTTLSKDITNICTDNPSSELAKSEMLLSLAQLCDELEIPQEFVEHELQCVFDWVSENHLLSAELGVLKHIEIVSESNVIFIYEQYSPKIPTLLQQQKADRRLTKLRYAISQALESEHHAQPRAPVPVQPLEPFHPRSFRVHV